MKLTALCLTLLAAPTCFALDAEAIREIAEKPHNRENLLRQLLVYTDAREYEISMKHGLPGEEMKVVPKISAVEHVVDGKYVVTKLKLPQAEEPLTMIVTFDTNDGVYRKYVLLPDGAVSEAIGTAAPNVRSISWLISDQTDDGHIQVLTNEIHSPEKRWWSEVGMKDGKVTYRSEGVALKTK